MEDITKPAPKINVLARRTNILASTEEEKTRVIASPGSSSMPKNIGEKTNWDEDEIKEKSFFASLAELFGRFGEMLYEMTEKLNAYKALKEEEEAYLTGKHEPSLEEQVKRKIEKTLNADVEQTMAQEFQLTKMDAPLFKNNKLKQEVLAKIFTERTQKELKAILAHINSLLLQNKGSPEFINEARKLFELLKQAGLVSELKKLTELQKRMERFQNKINAVEGSEKPTTEKARIIEALALEEQARIEAKNARLKPANEQYANKTENLKGMGSDAHIGTPSQEKPAEAQANSKHVEALQKRDLQGEQQIRQR